MGLLPTMLISFSSSCPIQSYSPSSRGEAQCDTLTIRTKALAANVVCAVYGAEPADMSDFLSCSHGPAGKHCVNAITDGHQTCSLYTTPPKYTLLEAAAIKRFAQKTDWDTDSETDDDWSLRSYVSKRDIVSELESWVKVLQIRELEQ